MNMEVLFGMIFVCIIGVRERIGRMFKYGVYFFLFVVICVWRESKSVRVFM